MSQFAERPQMRRKSSAQNLLSSFKTSTPSTGAGITIPPSNGAVTPSATTPLAREWDTQSIYSDSIGQPASGTPTIAQGTSVEYLRDLVQKRILTLTYVRNIHEGRSHWFHTIMISRAELDRVFNNNDMKKRTYRFAILGMSLSNLLDIHQPQDLLRGLINTLTEYDQSKEDSDKPKMRPPKRLFRTKNGKRTGGGFPEYAGYGDADASYLIAPHMPFPLDYHQTLLSLLDVLSEVYNKISKILGPSPFSHSSQHMMGPLGLLAPHPGVSYLFPDNNANLNNAVSANPYSAQQMQYMTPGQYSNPNLVPTQENDISLWGIANASLGGGAPGPAVHGSGLGSPPSSWTPSLAEMVLKVDGKFKKITSTLLKELDQFARNGIKDELSSLDPLLRNINVPEDGGARPVIEFERM